MFDPGGGVLVVVKQINMSESKQGKSLFHVEVASLGQIRHWNVVRLHARCQEKANCYWCMNTCSMELLVNGFMKMVANKFYH